jgi:hypothetical protein
MLTMLEEIRGPRPYERAFMGEGTIEQAEADLAKLSSTGAPMQRFQLHWWLTKRHLFFGNNQEALDHIQAAYELLPKVRYVLPEDPWEATVLQLALTHLRIGETANCVHCRTGESCVFPISEAGRHADPDGSLAAIKWLKVLLERNSEHLTARWLLNVACMTIGQYPDQVPSQFLIPAAAFQSEEAFPGFPNIAADLGLDTVSLAGGAIVDDFDGDGFMDIVVSSWGIGDQIRFFKNNGNGSFTDQTQQANLTGLYDGLNMIHADYDNDGDLDILVLRGAWMSALGQIPNSLLRNDGHARFEDVTFESGLGDVHYPTQTADWADYDNDGDLDLYIGNEMYPSQLFNNDGKGSFTDVAADAGVQNGRLAKGVSWGDFDNDRLPDLYVSNLNGPNRLYHNQGDGKFVDVAVQKGVSEPNVSFPTWFWDFNNDGCLDLFVCSYPNGPDLIAADYLKLPHSAEPDCLYQGDGRGGFRNVTTEQNLRRVTQPMGSNFGDLDNDGFPDMYLGTGYPGYEGLMPNLLFHNRRGTGFSDVTSAAAVGHLQKGHGVVFADIDHDGDQDIFIEMGGAYFGDGFSNGLFQNPGFENNWISITLEGVRSNRCAIGARIKATVVEDGQVRSIYKHVNSGGSFGSNPLRQHIGLGTADHIQTLEIFWPATNQTQVFENVPANQLIRITEDQQQFTELQLSPSL